MAQAGASKLAPPPDEANTENFLLNRVEPQWGHLVPCHWLDRTSSSLSFAHFSQ